MDEFSLIKQYFATQVLKRPDVRIGIGDDAAIVKMPTGSELAITTDTLVAGIHFPEDTSPQDIGHKSLAVNLSDLAAMGADPAWITLALTLDQANEAWIRDFCEGFFALANRYQVQLIGGDLTHGPTTITVQALGFLPAGSSILRSGANPGDLIYVTGTLGDAGLALRWLERKIAVPPSRQGHLLERLNKPSPQIEVGIALRGLASAAIDISDGLAADLTHLLEQSKVGAAVNIDQLPRSDAFTDTLIPEEGLVLALTAGDDYELCFTVPAQKRAELEHTLALTSCRYTCIGIITAQKGLYLTHQDGSPYHGPIHGYQHF